MLHSRLQHGPSPRAKGVPRGTHELPQQRDESKGRGRGPRHGRGNRHGRSDGKGDPQPSPEPARQQTRRPLMDSSTRPSDLVALRQHRPEDWAFRASPFALACNPSTAATRRAGWPRVRRFCSRALASRARSSLTWLSGSLGTEASRIPEHVRRSSRRRTSEARRSPKILTTAQIQPLVDGVDGRLGLVVFERLAGESASPDHRDIGQNCSRTFRSSSESACLWHRSITLRLRVVSRTTPWSRSGAAAPRSGGNTGPPRRGGRGTDQMLIWEDLRCPARPAPPDAQRAREGSQTPPGVLRRGVRSRASG